MKNFTNNFKQFTSRLSARWLIMALMMLVGTSSAWGVDYYLRGTFNNWGTNNPFLNNTCTITLEANKEYTFKIASSDWSNNNTYGKTNSDITETCEIELLNNTNNQAAGDCKITTKDAGNYTFVFTPNGSKGTLKVTYPTPTPTAPVVSTTSAVIDGENLVCKGKVTSMGSASTVVWAFTVLSTDAISKADSDWKYPNGQNKITAANTSFTYNIPISSLSLTKGNTYFVRAMAVDLDKPGISNNQYGNAVAGDAISFLYDPCSPPDAPTFDEIDAQCGSYTLPTEDKNKVSVNWYDSNGNKITSVTQSGTYYAEAVVDGTCVSENRTDVEITIKTKPTISISGSEEAVLYEDVTLTATATDGATVKWYEGGVEKATGITYVVTSETATTKTITAKAFLNGCESAAASHPVTFGEEDCNSTTTTEQRTVGKTKIIVDNPQNWSPMKCYAWRTSDKKVILGDWSGTQMTKNGNNYEILIDFAAKGISESDKIKVIFNNGSSQTVDSEDVSCNKIYRFSIGSKSGGKYSFTSQAADKDPYTEPVEVTVDPEITAPAAKTISVSTTDGEGNIIFSGQVVKTGCDATNEYGFQYSSDEQTWTTVKVGENAAAGTAISNNTVKELDGTYYVRAYITNDNSTQYGAITEITVSTKKTPITSVVLTHVKDVNGTAYEGQELENLTYCVGDEVWFELNYVGSTFIPENNVGFKWTTYPGNGLIGAYNGNKYKFTITGSGTIGISLRNDANVDGEGNPTWVESKLLEFKTHPEPTAPYISIDPASGIICEGSTATIKVENPSTDCSYKLVEEGSKAGFTPYKSGDLTYTVENVGKYYVVAQHNECTANEYTSNQVAINQIISTSATISIEPNNPETTPWEPVTITVKPAAGYIYELTYTDGNLAAVDGVRIKQNGDSYTYYIPRPDDWTTGDATPVRKTVNYGIKAQLKVDGEASECELNYATSTIQLKDEDNENCPK